MFISDRFVCEFILRVNLKHNFKEGLQIMHLLFLVSCGPFYLHGLALIPAWISKYMPIKVWDEITYPFLNFNGYTVEV